MSNGVWHYEFCGICGKMFEYDFREMSFIATRVHPKCPSCNQEHAVSGWNMVAEENIPTIEEEFV